MAIYNKGDGPDQGGDPGFKARFEKPGRWIYITPDLSKRGFT